MVLQLNYLEFPFPNDDKIFKCFHIFLLCCNHLPLEKYVHLNKLESPLPNDVLCQVWLLNWANGSGENENAKS